MLFLFEYSSSLLNAFEEILPKVDLVVFSDFNYGCLPQSLVDEMISKSKKANKLLVSDSQSSSQIGDISRFKGMDIVFATEREARISLQDPEDGLVVLADKLRENSQSKNIFLKLGSEGVLLHIQSEDEPSSYITDRLDSLNESKKIQVNNKKTSDHLFIIGSRSHSNEGFNKWVKENIKDYKLIKKGSSLKFCHIADGNADLYPRFGPTSEWDIAAGHIILTEAGGSICSIDNEEIVYNNKENILNPYFIASGLMKNE